MNLPQEQEVRITLEDVFQTACDLPPDKREAYLDEACAGNESMRREIEELIRYYETNKTFLEKPAIQDLAQEMARSGSLPNSSSTMIGRQLGNYRIQAKLGRGGMGDVYLARDLELDVDVVIKFLREEFKDDPEWQARFDREGRLNAVVEHPNIARVLYKDEIDGRQFLVFEYVPGETMEDRLEKGTLPFKAALPIFSQLADALNSAHSKGIIHRDLKPSNIMITPDGQVKVLDFGIAKKVTADLTTVESDLPDDDLTRDYGQTRKGEVMGTVLYMSPEQTRGEPLDARTDIWSFGCVLFESLAGKRPFGGINTYDTLNAIRQSEPHWSALPGQVPKPIIELLKKALRKDPRQRLRSAIEAKQTIDQIISPDKFWFRQLKYQMAIGFLLIVLVSTGVYAGFKLRSWWKISSIPVEKQLVVLPFEGFNNKQAGIGFADDLRRSLLSISDDWQTVSPSGSPPANLSSFDLQNLASKLGASLIVGGEAKQNGDQIQIKFWVRNSYLYVLREAEVSGPSYKLAELQNRIAHQLAEKLNLKLSAKPDAFSEHLRLNHSDATEQYLIAIGELQKELTKESVEKPIEILNQLIQSEGDSARFQQALARAYLNKYVFTTEAEWAEKALQACTQAISLAADQPSAYQITRGLVYLEIGKNDEAINDFKTALSQHPRDWEALNGMAMAYSLDGKYDEAEQTYLRAIAFWPKYWDGYNELGNFYYENARVDKAIESWNKVVELLPESSVGYNNLAIVYVEAGRENEALAAFQNSIYKDPSGNNYEAYVGMGTIRYDQRQYSEALIYFNRAIELANQAGRQQSMLYANRADTYRQLARTETQPNLVDEYNRQANADYDQAIGIKEKAISSGAAKSEFHYNLCEWLAKRGRSADALKCIKPATTADLEIPGMDYSATVVYLLAGNTERALQWLEKTACSGLSIDRLEKDPELRPLQSQPAYQSIINKCRQSKH